MGHSCRKLLRGTFLGHSSYHTSSHPPATRRIYASLCHQWHGATQTHFPPRLHKCQMALQHHERRVATCPHTEANISHDTTNHPAHQRHAAFTPACFALHRHANALSTKGAQIRMALRHHERRVATQSARSHARVSYKTSSKSHASRLQDERFVRDFLQRSRVKSPKRAFRTRLTPKVKAARRAFRTRLPPKVTHQVSKTSVSRETSSKSHTSSLQNERFVRDFLKNSHVKVCKTSVSYEPSSFAIPAPQNNTRSHANPNVTATLTSTTTHNITIPCSCHESFRVHASNAHKVLRLPRNVTSVTPRNLTIPCPCHENRTSTPQNPHKVLRLPRKVTISFHVSFTTRLE